MKYFLYRLKWYLAKYIIFKYPIHIDFELSSVCNLKCSFCPHSLEKQNFSKQFMDFDFYKQVIDEIEGKVLSIKFNLRGESTLHPKFVDFLEYAKGKFIDIRINTNGQYNSNGYLSKIISDNCNNISFSCDAFYTDTYKRKRNSSISNLYKNIEHTIDYCNELNKKPTITLSYVYTDYEKEEHEIDLFQRYWAGKYDKLVFRITPAMNRKGKAKILDGKKSIGRKNCYMPNRRLVITADQRVSFCCLLWNNPYYLPFKPYEAPIYMNVLEYWNEASLKCIRENLKNGLFNILPKMCKECDSSESYIWEEK